MNNFNLLLIDWDNLVGQLKADGISQQLIDLKAAGDYEQLSSVASSYLNGHLEKETSIWDRTIDPCNPIVGMSWVWIEFGETYSQMRNLLPSELMVNFDAHYLPFLAPFMSSDIAKNQEFQLPETINLLQAAGLSLALSPKHCKS